MQIEEEQAEEPAPQTRGQEGQPPLAAPPAARICLRAAHQVDSSCAPTKAAVHLKCIRSSASAPMAIQRKAISALLRSTKASAARSAVSSIARTGADAQNCASSSALRKRRRASMPAIPLHPPPPLDGRRRTQAPAAARDRASEASGGRRAAIGARPVVRRCRRLAGRGPTDGDAGTHAVPGLAAAAPCAGRAQLAAGRERMRDGGAQREPAPACRPPPRRARGRPHEGIVSGHRGWRVPRRARESAGAGREALRTAHVKLACSRAHSCSPDPLVAFERRKEASRLASGRRAIGSPRRGEEQSLCVQAAAAVPAGGADMNA